MKPQRVLVPLLVVYLLTIGVSSAAAVIAHLENGTTLSYQPAPTAVSTAQANNAARPRPFDSFFTNLDYGGGPIMTSNVDYTVYWRPSLAPAYPTDYKSGVNTYFKDLEHDSGGDQNVDSVATQYNDAAGEFVKYQTTFGGEIVDEHPYPANGCTRALTCLTDAQLRTELENVVSEQQLPTDRGHEYFLLTPEGVESCFEAGGEVCSANVTSAEFEQYCAYHGAIALAGGGEIVYANDPFVNGKNCDDPAHHINGSSDSALFGGLSHEHNESITDPEPNDAWTDWGPEETGEDGDKCRTFEPESEFGEPLGEVDVAGEKLTYNQEINGHKYYYQQEWSNHGAACLQRLNFNPSEAPVGRFSAAAVGSDEVQFDAAGSTAGEHVRYSWQFNDRAGHHESETIETETLSIRHAFPAAGVYTVALTVFKPDGTSIGAAHTIKVGGTGPAAKITITTGSPTAGQPVAFNGTESTDLPGGSIATYTWDFGDGSEASGAAQSHAYAVAGSYNAKLTVTGTDGLTASATRQVNVAAPPGGGSGGSGGSSTAQTTTPTPTTTPTTTPTVAPVPNSSFPMPHASLNARTGAITFTTSVLDPGIFSWLSTFPNGKFGAFASSGKCKTGFVPLSGKCRPAKIVFAKGSETVGAGGGVRVTLKPSSSALKALKNALRQQKGLAITFGFSFESSLGGRPVSRTQSLTVKLKKK